VNEIQLFYDKNHGWALEYMTMNICFDKTKRIVD